MRPTVLLWFGLSFVRDTSYFERFDIFPFPFLFFHFNGSKDEDLGKWLILSQRSNYHWLKDKFLSSTNVPRRFSDATKIDSKTFENAKIPPWPCKIVNTLVVLSKKLPHCRFETVLNSLYYWKGLELSTTLIKKFFNIPSSFNQKPPFLINSFL